MKHRTLSTIQSLGLIFLATVGTSKAFAQIHPGIPDQWMALEKAGLEREVEARSHAKVFCRTSIQRCRYALYNLLRLNWSSYPSRPASDRWNRIWIDDSPPLADRARGVLFVAAHDPISEIENKTGLPKLPQEPNLPFDQLVRKGIAEHPRLSNQDRIFYSRWRQKAQIHLAVVRGYYDEAHGQASRHEVFASDDQLEFDVMVQEWIRDYGFRIRYRTPLEAELVRETVTPDLPEIHLHFRRSTVPCPTEDGPSPFRRGGIRRLRSCSEQLKVSEDSLKFFTQALENFDSVIYVGHSRLGAGPDFGPSADPRTRFSIPNQALRQIRWATRHSELIYIDSCHSFEHFERESRRAIRMAERNQSTLRVLLNSRDVFWENGSRNSNSILLNLLQQNPIADLAGVAGLSTRTEDYSSIRTL